MWRNFAENITHEAMSCSSSTEYPYLAVNNQSDPMFAYVFIGIECSHLATGRGPLILTNHDLESVLVVLIAVIGLV